MTQERDTKTLILDKAERLFQSRGYNGFSYKDISRPLGIKNAAVHYHYPTKSDLGVALIERYRELLRVRTSDFMVRGGDPVIQLEGFLKFAMKQFNADLAVCPVGIMATDYHTTPEPMRKHAVLLVEETLVWLTRVLEVGREKGVFSYAGPAADKAVSIAASVQGARQLARIAGKDSLEMVIEQIRRDLGIE